MNVLSLFASTDTTAAYEALENLIADFNDHPDLQSALYGIGETCRAFKRYEDANSIYEQLVQRYPESSYAGKAQLEISEMDALSLIEKEDKAAAESAVNEITENFNDQSGLAASLYNIAERYDLSRKFEDANNIYRQIVEEHPDSPQADKARLRLAKLGIVFAIHSGKDETVGIALDNLIADFNSHPGLATAVFMVGEQYYYKAFVDPNICLTVKSEESLVKAQAIWERIIQELPVSLPDTAHAYYFSAVCYRKTAHYDKAIAYYQYVVDEWPAYEYAWSAQCLIGDCYERLRDSGSLSPSEANLKMEHAYMAVLENYPDCSLAPHACLKMAQLSLDRQHKLEAITFFEMFLEVANPGDPRIESVKARLEGLREAEG
jgi:TolA-binding protein